MNVLMLRCSETVS